MIRDTQQKDQAVEKNTSGRYLTVWRHLLSCARISNILNPARVDGADSVKPVDDRSNFERDYERVLFSPSFRKLAGKTQVRTFPDVDSVHNRLTHSMEVASVARTLGSAIARFLMKNGDIEGDSLDSICWICQAAGLAHDIGNPPYGHSGEYAIQYWAHKLKPEDKIFPDNPVWKDYECFDGNAQSFRILCTHESHAGEAFSFTAATAGALVKYPKTVDGFVDECEIPKFDVFSNSKIIFEKTWAELGLKCGQRHPLSYLTEAADDICYRVLDLEDAAVSDVIPEKRVSDIMKKGIGLMADDYIPLSKLRARLIRKLILDFGKCFTDNYQAIMTFQFTGDLKANLPVSSSSKIYMDEVAEVYKSIYTERRKVCVECGAYSQVPAILSRGYEFVHEAFSKSISGENCLPEYKRLSSFAKQFIVLAWNSEYYEHNRSRSFEWWMRALLDYVVDMTDLHIDMLAKKLI